MADNDSYCCTNMFCPWSVPREEIVFVPVEGGRTVALCPMCASKLENEE